MGERGTERRASMPEEMDVESQDASSSSKSKLSYTSRSNDDQRGLMLIEGLARDSADLTFA